MSSVRNVERYTMTTGRRTRGLNVRGPVVMKIAILASLDGRSLRSVKYGVAARRLTVGETGLTGRTKVSKVIYSTRRMSGVIRTYNGSFIAMYPKVEPTGTSMKSRGEMIAPGSTVGGNTRCLMIKEPVAGTRGPDRTTVGVMGRVRGT